MSNPYGFSTLRPAYQGESYYDTVTIAGSGSIAGWTLSVALYDAAGVAVAGVTPTATITDAANRVVQIAIANVTLDAPADYTIVLFRTDSGSQVQICWATLEVADPLAQLGWGAGF